MGKQSSKRYPYKPGTLAHQLNAGRERKAAVHRAAFIEQECPNAFDIFCTCGWYAHTLWGEEQAKVMFGKHLFFHGALPKVFA